MDKGYTTKDLIEELLGITISGSVDTFILQAQRLIENITGGSFKADAIATPRLYSGNNRNAILIDDCIEVTKLEASTDEFGTNFTDVADYVVLPINHEELEMPIFKIGLKSGYFLSGFANYRVTAKWGYSEEVPADIQLAATKIAAGLYSAENNKAIKSEKIGEYQVTYDATAGSTGISSVDNILQMYKKIEL